VKLKIKHFAVTKVSFGHGSEIAAYETVYTKWLGGGTPWKFERRKSQQESKSILRNPRYSLCSYV